METTSAIVHDRPCSISCDRLRSIAIVCDLRSAIIWKPAFRYNMVLSSAIVCDHDRGIADDRRSSFHMIADDRRPDCDLPSAIIWKPAFTSLVQPLHRVTQRVQYQPTLNMQTALILFCIQALFSLRLEPFT